MDKIKTASDINKYVFECAAKSKVYAGNDEKGNFIQVMNPQDITIAGKKEDKRIPKGTNFKVYAKTGRIGISKNSARNLKGIKFENTEICEQMKIPEQEIVSKEVLIQEINDQIQYCRICVEQMNISRDARDEHEFKNAKEKLEKEVNKLDGQMLKLAAKERDEHLYSAVVTMVNINNARLEFDNALHMEMTRKIEHTNKLAIRENPYAKHLQAMMEIKENLGTEELRGTLSNLHGNVEKTGYGTETHEAIKYAEQHTHDTGVTAVRDDADKVKNDTTDNRENDSDIADDVLNNPAPPHSGWFWNISKDDEFEHDEIERENLHNN